MRNDLAANIKAFRRERGLTQEQLAEVFGVTVGAVHKWEAGLSTPELSLILEMADFFDTSLDVLIGFETRDNRINVLASRLRSMTYVMDPDGTAEAEKALKKYPHNFAIVFECALLYGVYGINPRNKKYLTRSIELFEQALTLISQNKDPGINESIIYGQLAIIHQTLGDNRKALQIYETHNPGGIFDIRIGHIRALNGEYKKADEQLSRAMVKHIGDSINLVTGKAICYVGNKEYGEAEALLKAGLNENDRYRKNDTPNVLDKIDCFYLTGLAAVEHKRGSKKKAQQYLKQAQQTALRFDSNPDYDVKNLRFISIEESMMLRDAVGRTGMEAIEKALELFKVPELKEL